jgi:hypothetical protein
VVYVIIPLYQVKLESPVFLDWYVKHQEQWGQGCRILVNIDATPDGRRSVLMANVSIKAYPVHLNATPDGRRSVLMAHVSLLADDVHFMEVDDTCYR